MKLIIEIDGENHEVDLSKGLADALSAIAARSGIAIEDALAQAIANEKFLEDVEARGGRLLVEGDDKQLREVVREPEYA